MNKLLKNFDEIYEKIDDLEMEKDKIEKSVNKINYLYIIKRLFFYMLLSLTAIILSLKYGSMGTELVNLYLLANIPLTLLVLMHTKDIFEHIKDSQQTDILKPQLLANSFLIIAFAPTSFVCNVIFLIYCSIQLLFSIKVFINRQDINENLIKINNEISILNKKSNCLIDKIKENNDAILELLKLPSNKTNDNLELLKESIIHNMNKENLLIYYLENESKNKLKITID